MSRTPIYSPEVAAARAAEQQRRYQRARRLASQELVWRHTNEYKDLLAFFNAEVALKAGALPGDEVTP